jgi:hypothetical protein
MTSRSCKRCGIRYLPKRKSQKYCSGTCRIRAFAHVKPLLTIKQKKARKAAYYQRNKGRIRELRRKSPWYNGSMYRRKLRKQCLDKYGNRCASTKCKWANDDGTLGCTDTRCLQIDHVNGGGCKERKNRVTVLTFLKKVLADTEGNYQLLCANCNWIKRKENNEEPHRIKKPLMPNAPETVPLSLTHDVQHSPVALIRG